jgi:hypothetical protein
MSDEVTRREFLGRMAVLGAAVGAAPLLAACAKEEGAETTGDGAPVAMDCSDLTALTDAEVKTRTDLQYVEASVQADQNCLNCQQYTAGADAATCGTCTLVPGPINAAGWCLSWVAKV